MISPVRFGAVKLVKIATDSDNEGPISKLTFKLDGVDKNPLQDPEYADTLELTLQNNNGRPQLFYTKTTPPEENFHPWAYVTWEDLSPTDHLLTPDSEDFSKIAQMLKTFAVSASGEAKASVAGFFQQYKKTFDGAFNTIAKQIESLQQKSGQLVAEQAAVQNLLEPLEG